MITRKVAPALAAGCTVVIKPSELTPFSALALGVLAERAGIPAGVVNIVTGLPAEIGAELTGNEGVRKISFTGSTRVGSLLMAQSAPSVKRLSLELGGNAPFIVFDDADLDAAVEGALASKFRNGGQTCVCANRILVQAGVYDAFAERLAARVRALKVGPGTAEGVDVGPMINAAALEKIARHVDDALAKGASILARAEAPAGQYATPMVLTGATTEMVLASEETFGPVAPLFRFETEEEVIAIANGTPFGLAAYFYTESIGRAWRVGEALEFGMVGLNAGAISTAVAPFGGVKQSGLGREGARAGIEEYLELKPRHRAAVRRGVPVPRAEQLAILSADGAQSSHASHHEQLGGASRDGPHHDDGEPEAARAPRARGGPARRAGRSRAADRSDRCWPGAAGRGRRPLARSQ
jgi:succinate-semialdehyde dehydrogenase/glutarate-semialdehyde dehydrogenase